jgi:hypothetical protein
LLLLLLLQRLVLHMQNLTGLEVCSRGRKIQTFIGRASIFEKIQQYIHVFLAIIR